MLRFLVALAICSFSTHAQDFVENGWIAPQNLSGYLDHYNAQQQQVHLELDGVQYPLSLLDIDFEQGDIYLEFERGLVVAQLDEDPSFAGKMAVLLGNTDDLDALFQSPQQELIDHQAKMEEDGTNWVYHAMLENRSTGQHSSATLVINDSILEAGSSSLRVEGDTAVLTGILGTSSYLQLKALTEQHPEVTQLVFEDVQGSLFDGINLHSGYLIRQAGLTTVMPANGEAYSGGVDLFLAGAKRIYQPGGILGVHSWCCEEEKGADELPKSHPAHLAQLQYVRQMLGEIGPDFYFYTLEAAPEEGIHIMSHDEVRYYLSPEKF